MNLFGATYYSVSAGLPYDTVSVENRNCGGQCSSDCPSGVVTFRQSIVLRTKAIFQTSVQYCSGCAAGAPSLVALTIMLSWSRVNCRTEEWRRSESVENRAVLLVLKKILVYRTDELDQISMLLRPEKEGYFYLSGGGLESERLSESGGRSELAFGLGGYYGCENILRHAPIPLDQNIQFKTQPLPNIISAYRNIQQRLPSYIHNSSPPIPPLLYHSYILHRNYLLLYN